MKTFTNEELQQLFDSVIGQSIWNFLNSDSIIEKMHTSTQKGQFIEDVLYDLLTLQWRNELENPKVQDLIKEMLQQIMRRLGYTLVERIFHTNTTYQFVTSSRYKKTRHKLSVMDILGVGRCNFYMDNKIWLHKKDTNNAIFDLFFDEPEVVVEVTGKAVFEDFNTNNCEPPMDRNIFEPGSAVTILSELSTGEIYLRIRYFYLSVLDKCLEKITQTQEVILFGVNKRFPMALGLIEDSEATIRSMTLYPTDTDLRALADNILSGILEYAFDAKDEYGVKMSQYAKALKKRL